MSKKRTTLLERARAVPRKETKATALGNEEGLELAMAWARSELSTKQVTTAVFGESNPTRTANVLYYLASAFRWGIQNGKLEVKG